MCRLFTPISQGASHDTVQLPGDLKISLLSLYLCWRTTATVDEFIEYQISKLRIETVTVKNQTSSSVPPRIKIYVIYIVLSLNAHSNKWKEAKHYRICKIKSGQDFSWWTDRSKTNFNVCSLYIWVWTVAPNVRTLKAAHKKSGELLWAIASEKDFINLHSDAFDTVFGGSLVHA